MTELHTIFAVAGLWFLAAASPGPNFLLAVRIATRHGTATSLFAVAGIVTATAVWGLAGDLGVRALFIAAPWAYTALKVAGGAYLVWIGAKLILGSRSPRGSEPAADDHSLSLRPVRAFALGVTTNLANPKTAVFVTSLFAATIPASAPAWVGIVGALTMAAVSMAWYATVALLFGRPRIAAGFQRIRGVFDGLAGGCFVFFGGRLLLSER